MGQERATKSGTENRDPQEQGAAFNEMASMVSLGRYKLLFIQRVSYEQIQVKGQCGTSGGELAWHIAYWNTGTGAEQRVQRQGCEVPEVQGELDR